MSATICTQMSTNVTDYENYIMSSNNQIESKRTGGKLSTIVTYTDKTEWVFLNNKPEERFLGFLYLEEALKKSGLNNIKAAPNKMAIHQGKIVYLSQYCGEKKTEFMEKKKELDAVQKDIGFDMAGRANLRKVGEEIFLFDTEKVSFDTSFHKIIDLFGKLHDSIRSCLEERLKS